MYLPKAEMAALLFWISLALLGYEDLIIPDDLRKLFWYEVARRLFLSFTIALWVYCDALARGWDKDRISLHMGFVVLLTEIGVPVYLVQSRGWRGAGKTVLRFVVRFIVFAIMMALLTIVGIFPPLG